MANLILFNFFLYSLGAWAKVDYAWLIPLSQWDEGAATLFLITTNLFALITFRVVDVVAKGLPAFLLFVFSFLLLSGVYA